MLLRGVVLLLCGAIVSVGLWGQMSGAGVGAIGGASMQAAASRASNTPSRTITFELVSIHKSKPEAQGYDLNNTP